MMFSHAFSATCRGAVAAAVFLIAATCSSSWASQTDIVGPTGSVSFGASVAVLPNGNIVVTDPDASGISAKAGAVYLYTPNGMLISTVTGDHAQDRIGSNGVRTLGNGNFLILSPEWGSGGGGDVGAVTWVNGTVGLSGVVSAGNSLVGVTFDTFGDIAVTVLPNGNYVVASPLWNNGAVTHAGAVTWANGSTGVSGAISAANSLVGEVQEDCVGGQCSFGLGGAVALSNSNYIVVSPNWNNGSIVDAGAITWGDGSAGSSGSISAANSLVGTTANDRVGSRVITTLANGNVVVASPDWNNGVVTKAGAVTWIKASEGRVGPVSAANSLVGTSQGDRIGGDGVTVLSNGNYVVASQEWTNVPTNASAAGAVTWANGMQGISGAVSSANSLVGTTETDHVGSRGVTALSNGNYVVASHQWSNITMGAGGAGAVTWGNGTVGLTGEVSAANSLTGKINDAVGDGGVVALANGNYVAVSPRWGSNGEWPPRNYGAVTWAIGTQATSGFVSPTNSLVGSVNGDQVGKQGVVALTNGNYVVASPNWTGGTVSDAGAVTWGDGSVGATGFVSTGNSLTGWFSWSSHIVALDNGNYVIASPGWSNATTAGVGAVTWGDGRIGSTGTISENNSLVGATPYDNVGVNGIAVMGNGNYVVSSSNWSNGSVQEAGAVTFCNGATGYSGQVSPRNSLVGTMANDHVGKLGAMRLTFDHYLVFSYLWNNGATAAAGAVTLANDRFRQTGAIASVNSVRGTSPDGGRYMSQAYDATRDRLVVGRPADNIVSLLTMDQIFAETFE